MTRETAQVPSGVFFLSLTTVRMMLDVFLVTALVLRLVARSHAHRYSLSVKFADA